MTIMRICQNETIESLVNADFFYSCGTVALMVLGQFSDICGPMYNVWSAYIRKLAKDHKGYGSAANFFTEMMLII
jgi:hypothetical protein